MAIGGRFVRRKRYPGQRDLAKKTLNTKIIFTTSTQSRHWYDAIEFWFYRLQTKQGIQYLLLAFMSHKSCSPQFALILTSLFWQASEEEKLPNQREVDLTIDANYTARLHQRCERIKVVTTIRGRVTTTMRELESFFFMQSFLLSDLFIAFLICSPSLLNT